MDADRAAAVQTGPNPAFLFQKRLHTLFTDHTEILQRGLPQRILGSVPILLLHNVVTRIIRAFVTIGITVVPPFFAEDNSAAVGAEIRLVLIRPIASRTGIVLNLRP